MPHRLLYHQGFKKYFANTSWLMGEKVLRIFATLLVGVYVVRYLGPARFGILSFAMSFAALFQVPAKLGLEGIVTRNLVQEPEARNDLLGTAFFLRLAGGILLLGIVYFAIQFTDSDSRTQILVMIIAAGFVFQSFEVIDYYFQSQVWGKLSSISGLSGMILSSIIKLILIYYEASLIWFALVVLVENGTICLVLVYLYCRQRLPLLHWRFRWSRAQALLRDSWPLIFSGLAVMVYMRIDQVMIKLMMDDKAVGNYSAAVKISEAWYFLPMVLGKSLFPAILTTREISKERYQDGLLSFYGLMTWIGIGVALPTAYLSGWIIQLLFGAAYDGAASVLSIHIWAGVFVFMGVASSKYLLAENLQKFSFILRIAACFCNVVLNLFLIPKYGITGAALATVVSQCVASYLGYLLSPKTYISFKYLSYSLLYPFKKCFAFCFGRTNG